MVVPGDDWSPAVPACGSDSAGCRVITAGTTWLNRVGVTVGCTVSVGAGVLVSSGVGVLVWWCSVAVGV